MGFLTHVARQHNLLLAAVQGDLEPALDHHTVVDRQRAVDGRLHTWGEIDEADAATVGDVNGGLCKADVRVSIERCFGLELSWAGLFEGPVYLVVSRVLHVLIVVHVHRVVLGGVDDVGDCLTVDHDPVVVTRIVYEEDALALLVVAGDQAAGKTEAVGGEFGDVSFNHCEEFVFGANL